MVDSKKRIYPRTGDQETIYLKKVITDPNISVGEYTMYNDFVNNPVDLREIMCYITIQSTMTGC